MRCDISARSLKLTLAHFMGIWGIKKELFSIWRLQTASREIKKASMSLSHRGKIERKCVKYWTYYNYPFKLPAQWHHVSPHEGLLCLVDHRPKCSIVGPHCSALFCLQYHQPWGGFYTGLQWPSQLLLSGNENLKQTQREMEAGGRRGRILHL